MKTIWNKIISLKEGSILIVFILIQIVVIAFVPNYTSFSNFQLLLRAVSTLGILSLGVCLLMIAGEFDLSVGSTFALAPIIGSMLSKLGVNLWISLIITLLIGAAIGFINGIITVKGMIPSFIVTLGTMMAFRGLVLILSNGQPVYLETTETFNKIFSGYTMNAIPVQFIWLIVFTIIFWAVLSRHTFGNWIFATGGDPKASKAMGINTNRVKIYCFIILGVVAAFAGLLEAVRVSLVSPTQGDGIELTAIAAVVIGGTALRGGEGTVIGTFLGTVLMFLIQDILLLLRVKTYYFSLFVGVVIILAVLINSAAKGKRDAI